MPRHLLWETSCACQWGPSMGPVSASWELPAGAGAPPRILPEFCLKVARIQNPYVFPMFWITHFAHGLLVPRGLLAGSSQLQHALSLRDAARMPCGR